MSDSIANNVLHVRERIARAAERSGRNEEDILLVAVSKMQPIEKIYLAHEAGLDAFGENKVQDLNLKISESKANLKWHMIGHLQSNKINKVIGKVELIQSIDSISLLEKLEKSGQEKGVKSNILLQVNTSGEASKFGFKHDDVLRACEVVENMMNLRIQGLMTIGPITNSESEIAKNFSQLRNLSEEIDRNRTEKIKMNYLSMGMTGDFETAIEEGSNLVRIGTAIFGSRI